MEGFNFKIEYTATRNRRRILFVPLCMVVYIVLVTSINLGPSKNYIDKSYSHTASRALNKIKAFHAANLTSQTKLTIPYSYKHYAQVDINSSPDAHAQTSTIKQDHHFLPRFIHKAGMMYASLPGYAQTLLICLGIILFFLIAGSNLGLVLTMPLVLPLVFSLLFRKKYPAWWFKWNLEAMRFGARIAAFALFLSPDYPDTEKSDLITLDLPNPQDSNLSRWLPFFKWILVLPHSIILFFMSIIAHVLSLFMYFYVLISGQYPRPIFNFIEGYLRWLYRVHAYAGLFCTDQYPPFSTK